MSRHRTRALALLTVSLVALTVIACGGNSEYSEPEECGQLNPVSVPYIFAGTFTVDGEPGPQGVPMFATVGGCRGSFNNSIRPGEYLNVSIAPKREADIGTEVSFYLGHPDEKVVKAEETYIFEETAVPQIVQLSLSFPRLP